MTTSAQEPTEPSRAGTRSLTSDQPLTRATDDRLGRAPFAGAIAQLLTRWTGSESIVVAITGEWGSGKSTVKNFILADIDETSNPPQLDVLAFNPWQWSGPSALMDAFLRELGKALELGNGGKRDGDLAKLWEAYAARLRAGAEVAKSVRSALTTGAVVIATLGVSMANLLSDRWRTAAAAVAAASAVVAAFFEWGGGVATKVAASVQARGSTVDQSIEATRSRLEAALRKRARPLLVVIDDVDRLTAAETAQLFQLIKLSADLPKIIYLVLFQRDLVERSLDAIAPGASPGHGRAYLEKIVQVSFTMPPIEPARLERVLTEGLNEIIGDPVFDRFFDQHRWDNLYAGALREFFRSIRDVRRFLNTLDFHAGVFRGASTLEVNPIDLIGIETLRVFEPDIYQAINVNKTLFTGDPFRSEYREKDRQEDLKRLQAIIALVNPSRQKQVRVLFQQLFPLTERAFQNTYYNEDDRWMRELRVCQREIFDRYFLLSTPEGDVTQADIDRLFTVAHDRVAARRELESIRSRNLLPRMLARLEAYKEVIPLPDIVPFATALYDIGDSLPPTEAGWVTLAPGIQACRIIHFALKQEADAHRRADMLAVAFADSEGLFLPAKQQSLLGSKVRRRAQSATTSAPDDIPTTSGNIGENEPVAESAGPDQTDRPTRDERELGEVSATDLARLGSICLEKIRRAADADVLKDNPHLGEILFYWRSLAGGPEEVALYARHLAKSKEGALTLVDALSQSVTSQGLGDYVSTRTQYLPLKNLETFISASEIDARLRDVVPSDLSDVQAKGLKVFRTALRRRVEGLPDEP